MEPYLRRFLDAAHACPETLLEVALLDLAAGEAFDVRKVSDGVEADKVVGDEASACGRVDRAAFLDTAAAHGIPLLQQRLDFLKLRHKPLRLAVVAAVEEAAETLMQVTDEGLEGLQEESELGWGKVEFEDLRVPVHEAAEDVVERGGVPVHAELGRAVNCFERLRPLVAGFGTP